MTDPDNAEMAFCSTPTRRERVIGRLFPARHVEAAFPEWAGNGDCLYTTATVGLSLVDRVRVLLTGRLAVRTVTTCEFLVGRTVSVSESYVEPPSWLSRGDRSARFR
jgi:hypothetical protein